MSSRVRFTLLGAGAVLVACACADAEAAPAPSFNDGKAPPPDPCLTPPRPVAIDAATQLGATPAALLERLGLGDSTPFVWGPYEKERSSGDRGPSTTTYVPGPGTTRVTLGMALRENEDALQTVYPRDAGS